MTTTANPVNNDPTQLSDAAKARLERTRRREEKARSGTARGEVALGQTSLLNLGETVPVCGLDLFLKPPAIKKVRALQSLVWTEWPDVIIYAALTKPATGGGIDLAAVASLQTSTRRREKPDAPEVTLQEVATEFTALGMEFGREVSEGDEDPLEPITEAVWRLASETPGLTREGLQAAIEENITVPGMVDLLRLIFQTTGGFPGCMADRFQGSPAVTPEAGA